MKNKAKYFIAIVLAGIVLVVACFAVVLYTPTNAETKYNEISLTDMGKPIFAGTGESSFDEDTLYYSSGNTVGYNMDMRACLLTADYT